MIRITGQSTLRRSRVRQISAAARAREAEQSEHVAEHHAEDPNEEAGKA